MHHATRRSLLLAGVGLLCAAGAALAAPELGSADFRPSPQQPVGWRGDGTGRFPAASPVSNWDIQTGRNVVWKTELGFFSCSSPIVVGGKVFTTAEPDELICVDAATGKTLWSRHLDPNVEKLPVEEQAALYAKYRTVAHDVAVYITGDNGIAEKLWIRGGPNEPAKATAPKVGKTPEQLAAEYMDLYSRTPARGFNLIGNGWWWHHGNTWPTPASDGTHVVVKMGSKYVNWGRLACFDLDGNRQWVQNTGVDECWGACCSSPLIVGDLVISLTRPKGFGEGRGELVAFRMADGEKVWSVPCGITTASPICIKVDGVDVVVAGSKDCGGGYRWINRDGGGPMFVRARDGKVVLENLQGIHYRLCSPTWEGDVLLVADNPSVQATDKAPVVPHRFRLSWRTPDELSAEPLGPCVLTDPNPKRRITWMNPRGSFLLTDGMLYKQTGELRPTLSVYDTKAGRTVGALSVNVAIHAGKRAGEHPCGAGVPSDLYGSAALGGDLVFGVVSAHPSQFIIVRHGEKPTLVSEPTLLSAMSGNPYFQGDRMYARDYRYLYCIGPTAAKE